MPDTSTNDCPDCFGTGKRWSWPPTKQLGNWPCQVCDGAGTGKLEMPCVFNSATGTAAYDPHFDPFVLQCPHPYLDDP